MSSTTDFTAHAAPTVRAKATSRLRIAIVVEAANKGTGKHVMDLSAGLLARGCEVHLLYSPVRMDDTFRARMTSMRGLIHVPVTMYRSIRPQDMQAVVAVRRYLKQFGPFDVIHGHSSKGGAVARLAAVGTGTPAMYTPHALVTMTPKLPRWKRSFFTATELVLSKLARYIIAVSPAESRLAVASGLGAARVVTIPNGVDRPSLSPRDDARRICGADEGEIVIGSVGRLVENKAPDVLLKSVAIALQTCPNLRLVVLGDGPLKQSLAELAATLGIADKVRLLGEYDARKVFAAFDIFAISSRMESMPYVLLEAMAAGQPIVATVTSGVETLVEQNDNGLIVPMDDCEAFAAALVKLASNPLLIQRMGRASLDRIAPFSTERMIDQILDLYRRCAGAEQRDPIHDDELQLAGEME